VLGLWGLRRQPLLAAFVVAAALLALGPISPLYMAAWHGATFQADESRAIISLSAHRRGNLKTKQE
jgi:hypothetical protein